jgi:hypothetical protein
MDMLTTVRRISLLINLAHHPMLRITSIRLDFGFHLTSPCRWAYGNTVQQRNGQTMQIERNTASEMDLEKVHNPRVLHGVRFRALPSGGLGSARSRRPGSGRQIGRCHATRKETARGVTSADRTAQSVITIGLPRLVFLLNPNEPVACRK